MEITIRNVNPEDLDRVTAIEAACFPEAEAAGREAFRQRIGTFPDSFFVLEADGQPAGFINGCATDERVIRDVMYEDGSLHKPDGKYQSVFGLDVLPDYRRLGLAARLMEHLIGDARRRGRLGLILTCKDRLIHYYETFGYVNQGISRSTHGGAVWYDMVLEIGEQYGKEETEYSGGQVAAAGQHGKAVSGYRQ